MSYITVYSVEDNLPEGNWSKNHIYLSKKVLFCNDLSWFVGYYNRNTKMWYIDEPAKEEWVDDVTHWSYLPDNPNNY
jgi:hypothetical protein